MPQTHRGQQGQPLTTRSPAHHWASAAPDAAQSRSATRCREAADALTVSRPAARQSASSDEYTSSSAAAAPASAACSPAAASAAVCRSACAAGLPAAAASAAVCWSAATAALLAAAASAAATFAACASSHAPAAAPATLVAVASSRHSCFRSAGVACAARTASAKRRPSWQRSRPRCPAWQALPSLPAVA